MSKQLVFWTIIGTFFSFFAMSSIIDHTFSQAVNIEAKEECVDISYADAGAYRLKLECGTTHVFFKSRIVDAESYSALIEHLSRLKETDKVVMHFANFGGDAFGALALFNAFTNTKAHKVAEIEAPTMSAGALLACTADTVNIQYYSFLMYHSGSLQTAGVTSAVIKQLDELTKLDLKMLQSCVKHGILTKSQIESILKGEDIYVHPEDLKSHR